IEFDCRAVMLLRLGCSTDLGQRVSEVDAHRHIPWLRSDCGGKMTDGIFPAAFAQRNRAELVVRERMMRLELDRAAEGGGGLVETILLEQRDAEVVVAACIPGTFRNDVLPQGERRAVGVIAG